MDRSHQGLPSDVVSRLIRLLDEPGSGFARGVAAMCAEFPALAGAIGAEADIILRDGRRPNSVVDEAAGTPLPEPMPSRIGPFQIVAEIGQGGMGTVYLAERSDLKQRVALKVIKLGMDTRAVLARFDAERVALARMEHNHVAKVLDAGTTERGHPWFAMEHVKGEPITRYCDNYKLTIEERLRLFQQVCSGVQHAHTKGVVHRDLTPNNILVTVQEGRAVAKIIDFGLAKATDRGLTDKTLFTERGLILGTPEYMAPEQAGIDALDIDTRADVYTLGVLLYELLVGALPFSRAELRGDSWDTLCKTIQTKDPPRPSTKITSQADTQTMVKARRTDASALRRRLRGDLDWVVMKCLEKDRTRRYETATELAADVQRHLDYEPVLARGPSLGYRLWKTGRRYRGHLLAAGLLGTSVVVGMLGMQMQAQAAIQQRQRAMVFLEAANLAFELHWTDTQPASTAQGKRDRTAAQARLRKRARVLTGRLEQEISLLRRRSTAPRSGTRHEFVDGTLQREHDLMTAAHASLDSAADGKAVQLDKESWVWAGTKWSL